MISGFCVTGWRFCFCFLVRLNTVVSIGFRARRHLRHKQKREATCSQRNHREEGCKYPCSAGSGASLPDIDIPRSPHGAVPPARRPSLYPSPYPPWIAATLLAAARNFTPIQQQPHRAPFPEGYHVVTSVFAGCLKSYHGFPSTTRCVRGFATVVCALCRVSWFCCHYCRAVVVVPAFCIGGAREPRQVGRCNTQEVCQDGGRPGACPSGKKLTAPRGEAFM